MPRRDRKISIKKKLKKEKFKVLSTNKFLSYFYRDSWEEVKEAYKKQPGDPQFVTCSNRSADKELLQKLKTKCKETLCLIYDSQTKAIYLQAKKWCVVPHKLEKRAKKLGYTFLNLDVESNKDLDYWELRAKDYRVEKEEINLNWQNRTIDQIKRLAGGLINKMNYEEDSEEAWATIIRWFTKRRP